jgi:hypothetical protein
MSEEKILAGKCSGPGHLLVANSCYIHAPCSTKRVMVGRHDLLEVVPIKLGEHAYYLYHMKNK